MIDWGFSKESWYIIDAVQMHKKLKDKLINQPTSMQPKKSKRVFYLVACGKDKTSRTQTSVEP